MRLHRLGFLFLPFREYKENGDGRPASPCVGGSDRPWDQLAGEDGRGISCGGRYKESDSLTSAIGDRMERTGEESPLTDAIRMTSEPFYRRQKGSDREVESEIPLRRLKIPFWRHDKGSGRVRSERESGRVLRSLFRDSGASFKFLVYSYFGPKFPT